MRNVSADTIIMIRRCVEDYFDDYTRSPSVREISNMTGISKSTVQRYIEIMERVGIITRTDEGIETPYISKTERNMVSVAKLGRIPCGPLDEKEEYIEGYVKLPESFVGKGKFFILVASGDSMIDAGIMNGDKIVVRRQQTAENGEIVVALVEDSATVKRFYRKNGQIILHPENEALSDMIYEDHEVRILGKVVGLMRNYRS